MAIPLELRTLITASGLETFGMVQKGISSVASSATQTSSNLQGVARSLSNVMEFVGALPTDLAFATAAIETLSMQASITPASLDALADRLSRMRAAAIQTWQPTLDLSTAVSKLSRDQWLLQNAILEAVNALRTQATALQGTGRSSAVAAEGTRAAAAAMKEAAGAAKFLRREARASALTGMNVLSSATQGVMMAMGLLQGSITSVGFGLIFLRYSIAPITLGIAGLIAAIGGTIRAITFVGPAFEKLVTEPMNKMKDAVLEAIGYFSGAVWVRIIAPSIRILADLAEKFRGVALQMWLSADVQRAWAELLGMVQGTFQNLSKTIKEHGGILRWVVRTGFIMAINVLKGLVYLVNIAITLLPQMAYFWKQVSGELKRAWAMLGLVAQGLKELGLEGVLQRVKEFALNITLEDMFRLALGVLTGGLVNTIIIELTLFLVEGLMEKFTTFDEDVRDKWMGVWKWVGTGALVGSWIGGAPGAIVGMFLGGIIGMFLSFRDELQTIGFDIAANLDSVFGNMIDGILAFENILDAVGIGMFPESVEESMRKWRKSSDEFQRLHEMWRTAGRPVLEGWSGQWEDLRKAVQESTQAAMIGQAQDPSQLAAIRENWERMWREIVVESMAPGGFARGAMGIPGGISGQWGDIQEALDAVSRGAFRGRPYPGGAIGMPGGMPGMMPGTYSGQRYAGGAIGMPGGTVINVTVTGNNMYGKLDDETARIWAQQLGFYTMNRLATRRGIGVR